MCNRGTEPQQEWLPGSGAAGQLRQPVHDLEKTWESWTILCPKAILETVLYVDDLDEAGAFYRDVLRLTPVHSDARMQALRVCDENFLLLFRRGATTEPVVVSGGDIPPHDGSGSMHVAFSMDKKDAALWPPRLEKNNVPIESTVNWPSGEVSIYFRDPAGNLVELATPNLWTR